MLIRRPTELAASRMELTRRNQTRDAPRLSDGGHPAEPVKRIVEMAHVAGRALTRALSGAVGRFRRLPTQFKVTILVVAVVVPAVRLAIMLLS